MKLVDILAREFKVWPNNFDYVLQQPLGKVFGIAPDLTDKASDWLTARVTRSEWQAAVDALNAPKVVEWDEFGFPPAGVSCEFTSNDGYNWKPCRILYADELSILTGELEGKADRRLLRKCDADVKFRPARTAEQVAAEEREKAIADLYFTINWNEGRETWPFISNGRKADYEKAIDAGYTKVAK